MKKKRLNRRIGLLDKELKSRGSSGNISTVENNKAGEVKKQRGKVVRRKTLNVDNLTDKEFTDVLNTASVGTVISGDGYRYVKINKTDWINTMGDPPNVKKKEEVKEKPKEEIEISEGEDEDIIEEKLTKEIKKYLNPKRIPEDEDERSIIDAIIGLTKYGGIGSSYEYGFNMDIKTATERMNNYLSYNRKALKLMEKYPDFEQAVFTYVQEPKELEYLTELLVKGSNLDDVPHLKRFHENMERLIKRAKISKPVTLARSIGKDMWDKVSQAKEFDSLAMSSWTLGDDSATMFGDYKIIWDVKGDEPVCAIGATDLMEFVGSSSLRFKVNEKGDNFIKVQAI